MNSKTLRKLYFLEQIFAPMWSRMRILSLLETKSKGFFCANRDWRWWRWGIAKHKFLGIGLSLLNSFFAVNEGCFTLSLSLYYWIVQMSFFIERSIYGRPNALIPAPIFLFSDFFCRIHWIGHHWRKTKSGCFKKQMLTQSFGLVFFSLHILKYLVLCTNKIISCT
jgi:hypothetical protein